MSRRKDVGPRYPALVRKGGSRSPGGVVHRASFGRDVRFPSPPPNGTPDAWKQTLLRTEEWAFAQLHPSAPPPAGTAEEWHATAAALARTVHDTIGANRLRWLDDEHVDAAAHVLLQAAQMLDLATNGALSKVDRERLLRMASVARGGKGRMRDKQGRAAPENNSRFYLGLIVIAVERAIADIAKSIGDMAELRARGDTSVVLNADEVAPGVDAKMLCALGAATELHLALGQHAGRAFEGSSDIDVVAAWLLDAVDGRRRATAASITARLVRRAHERVPANLSRDERFAWMRFAMPNNLRIAVSQAAAKIRGKSVGPRM